MAMATVMLVAAGLVGGAGSAEAAPAVSGTGYLACSATTGKVKMSPGLGTVAAAGLRSFTAKLTLACDGGSNPAYSVGSGKATLTFSEPATRTCATLPQTFGYTGSAVLTVKFKASGAKLNPTRIVFPSHSSTEYPPTGQEFWGFAGDADLNAAVITGSYAGEDADFTIRSLRTVIDLQSTCTAKGYKTLALGHAGMEISATPF